MIKAEKYNILISQTNFEYIFSKIPHEKIRFLLMIFHFEHENLKIFDF